MRFPGMCKRTTGARCRPSVGLVFFVVPVLLCVYLLTACGIATQPPVESATPTTALAVIVTDTPMQAVSLLDRPTRTPAPSPTATATMAPTATRTPAPTATRWVVARLTMTPEPTATPVTQAAEGEGTDVAPAQQTRTPQPYGGRIVMQLSPGGWIYTINADGTHLRQIGRGMDPAWAPDGNLIAFTVWEPPRGLYVMQADGTDQRLLFGGNQLRAPAWSADGSKIVFSRQHGGREAREICFPPFGCFTLPADLYWRLGEVDVWKGGFRDIPSDLHSFSPAMTSDGQTVVYIGDQGLQATSLENGRQSLIQAEQRASSPAVSPDGRHIVYMVYLHDHWDLFITDVDGKERIQLTHSPALSGPAANNVAPAWSPDGKHILFLTDREGPWRVYIMNPEGTGQRPFLADELSRLDFDYQHVHERALHWGP